MDWWRIVCCAAAGYLLGSCNGAIVVSHTCMHDDIRKKGSGNAGLTNFLRNFGGWATLLVVLMDMGKVVLACLLGRWLLPGNPQLGMMIAGAMTELGHIFPVFYGFRGGKGIATMFGAFLFMHPLIAIVLALLVIAFIGLIRIVSLASLLGVTIAATVVISMDPGNLLQVINYAAFWLLAVVRHWGNIKRLLKGEERKLDFRSRKKREQGKE